MEQREGLVKRTKELGSTRFRQEDTRGMLSVHKGGGLVVCPESSGHAESAQNTPDRRKKPFLNSHPLDGCLWVGLYHFPRYKN